MDGDQVFEKAAGFFGDIQKLQDNVEALLKHASDPGKCFECGAAIFWFKHQNGKRCPYDADLTSHYKTCDP